jgi:hypothetical protein
MRFRIVGWAWCVLAAVAFAPLSRAQGLPSAGHFGPVLEVSGEFGGDNVVEVFYRDGTSQNIKAGQGVTVAAGLHYQPPEFPIDFAATAGYKFVRTEAYDTDLGMDRVVIKLTGTYMLPNHFWVDAGPVWHTDVHLNGAGYIPDVDFDQAVGVTVGVGWRWLGLTYTNIHYSSPVTGTVDGSNGGVTFIWKF